MKTEPNPKVTAGVLAIVVTAACLLAYSAAVGVAAGQQVEVVDSSEVQQEEQPSEVRYVVMDGVWVESYRYDDGDLRIRLQSTSNGQKVLVKDQLSRFDEDAPGYNELVTLQQGTTEVVVPDVGMLRADGVIGTTELFTVTVANPTNSNDMAIVSDSPGVSISPPMPSSGVTWLVSTFGVFLAMLGGTLFTLSRWQNKPRIHEIKPKRPITPWDLEWPKHHAMLAVAVAVVGAVWLALYLRVLEGDTARGILLLGTLSAFVGSGGGLVVYLVRTDPNAVPVVHVDEDAEVLDILMPNLPAWNQADVSGDVPRPRRPEQAEGYSRAFVVKDMVVPEKATETALKIAGTWRSTMPVDMVEASLEWLENYRDMERKSKLVPRLKARVARARREGINKGVRMAGRAADKLTTGDTEDWDWFSDELGEYMEKVEQAEDDRDDREAMKERATGDLDDEGGAGDATLEEIADEFDVELSKSDDGGGGGD